MEKSKNFDITTAEQQKILNSIPAIGTSVRNLHKKTHIGVFRVKKILITLEEKGYCRHINVSPTLDVYYKTGSIYDPLLGVCLLRVGRQYLRGLQQQGCVC